MRDTVNQLPAVSIIVPVYNVANYLKQCVESLTNQTLQNIEILLVDDGSTDGSSELVDLFAERDHRIRVFHKPNGGLSDARNFALPFAKAPYIGFVDSDDWVDVTMFEKLLAVAIDTKAECVVCDAIKHHMTTGAKNPIGLRAAISEFGKSVQENPILIWAGHSYAWNKLFHRRLLQNPDMQFPVGQLFEDSAIIYNIMAEANKIECVNEPLYNYRFARPGAITQTVSPKIFDIFKSCESIMSYFSSRNMIDGEMEQILEKILRNHILARFDVVLQYADRRSALRFVSASMAYLDQNFRGWRTRYKTPSTKKYSWLFASRKSKPLAFSRILAPRFLFKFARMIQNAGFNITYDVTPVPDEKLQFLQAQLTEILDQFDLVCQEHNLRYYLSEGTLLGAIRHNGFIPWDDDLDVAMPRSDYEQLLALTSDQWPASIRLWGYPTDPRYPLPFSKIVRTVPSEFKNVWPTDNSPEFSRPYIDVFPLDKTTVPEGTGRTSCQLQIRKWRDLLLIKRGYKVQRTNRNRFLLLIAPFLSFARLHGNIRRASTAKTHQMDAVCIVNLASSYHPSKQTVPQEWYGEPKMVMFEGKLRPCPSNSHDVLTTIYGDYKILPPAWKRGRSTHFMSYSPQLT